MICSEQIHCKKKICKIIFNANTCACTWLVYQIFKKVQLCIYITLTLNLHSGKHGQLNKIRAPHEVESVLQHFHEGNLTNDIYANMNDYLL